MGTFALEFRTNNAAFGETEDDMQAEIGEILTIIGNRIKAGGFVSDDANRILDSDGNVIGEFKLLGRFGIGDKS